MNIEISGNALQLLEDFIYYASVYPDRLADAIWYDLDWFVGCLHYLDKAVREATVDSGQKKMGRFTKAQPTLPDDFDRRFPEPIGGKLKEWLIYKTERKDYYSPTGLRNLLAQIDNRAKSHSAESIADLISVCMANNWKGIIWDRIELQDARLNGRRGMRSQGRRPTASGSLWSEFLSAEQNEDA